LLTDLKNTVYDFGTLLHCFKNYSRITIIAQIVLLWRIRKRTFLSSVSLSTYALCSNVISSTSWTRESWMSKEFKK